MGSELQSDLSALFAQLLHLSKMLFNLSIVNYPKCSTILSILRYGLYLKFPPKNDVGIKTYAPSTSKALREGRGGVEKIISLSQKLSHPT